MDTNGNIVEFVGIRSYGGLGANSYTTGIITINNCFALDNVPPGLYQLRILVRLSDNEQWRIANMSLEGTPTAIPFTVNPYVGATPGGGYRLVLENFTSIIMLEHSVRQNVANLEH
jgi:hypothetical protein